MKKILSHTFLFAALVIAGMGCLKDKGFDNHEYGINDPDGSPAGVGFVNGTGARAKNSYGLDVGTNLKIPDIVINFDAGVAPTKDVRITLVVDPTIVTDYNAANGTNTQVLPTSAYSFPLTVTIPAGQRLVSFNISIPSSINLNPTIEYGIGIRIASVDGGFVIARNLRNLFYAINIKNKYDGKYNLRGFHNRPGLDLPYNVTVYMITTGPSSVAMWYLPPGPDTYAHPINGNGGQYYGTFTSNFTFDATNKMTAWDWTPYPTTLPTTVDPAGTSRFDQVTKIIYFSGWYNNNPGGRKFTDTLRYLGPRP